MRANFPDIAFWLLLLVLLDLPLANWKPILRPHQSRAVEDFFCGFNHLCEPFLVPHIASVGAVFADVLLPFYNGYSSQKFASAAD